MIEQFSLIEAPVYQGQKHFGVSLGPAFIRQFLHDQHYNFQSYMVSMSQSLGAINLEAYENISYTVERELRRKNMVFVAGGDHSLSIGSIQGALRYNPDIKVIWIDAHADINTRTSSLTQSYHGMPLSFLTQEDRHLKRHAWFQETLNPQNLMYLGLRDIDLAEKNTLSKHSIKYFTSDEINSSSFNEVLKSIKEFCRYQQVVISLDADAFDPSIARSTGVPVEKGLSCDQVDSFVQTILDVAEVISYEFVELNPQIFDTQQDVFETANLGIKIFNRILNQKNQQRRYYGITDRDHKETKSVLDYGSL